MVAYTKHDLQFILDGINVSESHAAQTNTVDLGAGTWTVADLETSRQILLDLIPNSLEPIGMRTISGELNNLVIDQADFGATGEFPRLLDPNFRDEGDDAMAFGPPIIDPGTGLPLIVPGVNGPGTGVPEGYIPGPGGNFLNANNYTPNGANTTPDPRDIEPSDVVDADPRIISNLIVDQTINNPVAVNAALNLAGVDPADATTAIGEITTAFETLQAALLADPNDQAAIDTYNGVLDGWGVEADTDGLLTILNTAPDEGLSAPFNSWMTLFGQFFDHGLDLVGKGGNGTVYIPLQSDDPLFDANSPTNFMVLTRATLNENGEPTNFTSPFVDQNQTYTSHPSHQIFVRQYDDSTGVPLATGLLIEGAGGGMATWGEVKAQAREMLGIELTDAEALNIPLFAVDQYGEFLRGGSGLPQFVIELQNGAGDVVGMTLVEGQLPAGVGQPGLSLADAVGIAQAAEDAEMSGLTAAASLTGFAFLLDIAHTAAPVFNEFGELAPDLDLVAGAPNDPPPEAGTYDNELFDAHFIAGDGRANENIGLTAVHHVFHGEHNRLVEHTKESLLSTENTIDLATVGDPTGEIAALELLNGYLLGPPLTTFPTTPTQIANLVWDGDRLFQAAKFGTEMQYQHLVFEEFARKVQPLVDLFASYESSIDAKIVAEFAHTVYRFGHSMLTETVDLMDEEGNLTEAGLIEVFLNPLGFHQDVDENGLVNSTAAHDSAQIAGDIIRGMTRQQGNEIDELVTEALRNNLLGLPLDLAAINLARGRETGIPSLNDARDQFFEGTGDTKLKPYDNWVEFALNLKNGGAAIVNFIAAYGTHDLITDQATIEAKRAAAFAITTGDLTAINELVAVPYTAADIADRVEYLHSRDDDGSGTDWSATETGLNLVDFWIGGLAEAIEPFGGMLGSTFNFVFEQQLEDLQDGDRFYYLGRTGGLNFLSQLEQNSFANMIIRNTDIGDIPGGDHLPGDIFSTPAWILEVDQSRQITGIPGEDIAIMESGTATVDNVDGVTWHTVTFTSPIESAVVSMSLNTVAGTNPATVRVRDVTSTGFEFQIDEYDYLDGAHITETLSWVAVAAGEHTLSDGTIVKAGTATEDAAGSSAVAFGGTTAFTGVPVVLTQVSTVNEDTAVVPRVQAIDANGFNLRLREQEAGAGGNGTAHATETVGWIAIQQGDGTLLSAGTTGDGITHLTANITHTPIGTSIVNPAFIAQMQTRDGNDTATVRGINFDGNNATFFIEEEQSANAELAHTGENVGFLAIPTGVIAMPAPLNGDPTGDGATGGELNPFLDLGSNSLVIRANPDGSAGNYLHYTGGDHVVLGGTEQNDTLIGGIGDDTLWGDGGDDDLEGGDGGDILLGGAGDDVITDLGGPNNLQGQDGNDAIFAGGGESLILGGAGQDFVLQGPDFAETFGGLGNDFIHAGDESNIVFGNEGNDWLEGGGGNNLLVGDNGDPFLSSTAGGHDVFISGLGDDDYDAEGGDDIMEGADGVQRFEGVNGFDWATYMNVDQGVSVDMLLRAFDETPIPASNVSILDRFDSVEGLSGSSGNDILRGDNVTEVEQRTIDNGNDSVLRNFDLIDGLRGGPNGIFAAGATEWAGGEIMLGGAGGDLIEGRGGNDIIDGDLKLDASLAWTARDGAGAVIATGTARSMLGELVVETGPGVLPPGITTLNEAVFARVINPGDIEIVREIINESDINDFDTVLFSGNRDEYTITELTTGDFAGYTQVQHNSAAGVADGLGADGTDVVRNAERLRFADQTVEFFLGQNSPATGSPELLLVQDPDGARIIQPLTIFAAGDTIRAEPNVGAGGIADGDGFPAGGATFSYIWQFEETPGAGDFIDFEILNVAGEVGPLQGQEIVVPSEAIGSALRVRVEFFDLDGAFEIVFSDPTNIVASAIDPVPTPFADFLVGTTGNDTIDALAGDDIVFGDGGNDRLIGNLGDDQLFGGVGDDILEPGPGNDILDGGAGFDVAFFAGAPEDFVLALDIDGNLEVIDNSDALNPEENVLFNVDAIRFGNINNSADDIEVPDALNTLNALAADPATDPGEISVVANGGANILAGPVAAAMSVGADDTINAGGGADLVFGLDGNDTLNGENGADEIFGGSGNDIIDGGDDNDAITGGADDDTIDGGTGDDEIFWTAGDGRDLVDGGGGAADVFDVTGDAAVVETFRVIAVSPPNPDPGFGPLAVGTEIIVTRNDGGGEVVIAELDNIEELVINGVATPAGGGGAAGDTVLVVGDFTNTSLALATITINGSSGNDSVDITGLESAHRIVFRSGGGDDVVIGTLRAQDVVELAPGLTPADYDAPVYNNNGTWTITENGGGHSVTYTGGATMTQPAFVAGVAAPGSHPAINDGFAFTANDLAELKNLVNGIPSANSESAAATGVRDLEGTGNNVANPNYGAADQPFIRLTDARYGENDGNGVPTINPIFDGLDARTISNVISTQEADLAPAASEANIFFMAFGQYFDHGLDFLQKGGSGEIAIGTGDDAAFADLTRGSLVRDENGDIVYGPMGETYHTNKTSPFVDQNQAYGSTELVGQFLRASDGDGGYGAKLLSGGVDPSNTDFRLLPTLRELIQHHWDADTVFTDPGKGGDGMTLKAYYSDLIDDMTGEFDAAEVGRLNSDFMGSGHTLVGDANGFINILDHYVAGDLRANENVTLTSIHTVWARNHNYHVDKLVAAGFDGNAEELFQAAKIVNEAEYQRVVFDEFADHLIGGLRGSGSHGFDEYDPNVDASISHEFAGAAYRFGHSLIGQTITVLDDDGQPKDVNLFDAFLNPTNQTDVFQVEGPGGLLTGPDAIAALNQYGYVPQEGYEQLGVSNIVGGIVTQPAEEVDPNVVDAVRDDLVRIHADLAAFNIARGWDLGLGTLNQVRNALNNSGDAYVSEAVDLSNESLTPYTSWEDFQARNDLSDEVINQFKQAYPDLVLEPDAIAAFAAANPDIALVGGNTVKGIDRVDLWVGGLAEEHINGGVVGSTFWVILHEQFDRLQQGDRHYYIDRVDGFDFYEQVEDQSLADIVARNTGLQGLSDDIFRARDLDVGDGDGAGDNGNTDTGDAGTGDNTNGDTAGDNGAGTNPANSVIMGTEATLVGTDGQDIILGGAGNRVFEAGGGDDVITTGNEDAVVFGGDGDDLIESNDGNDIVFGDGGTDTIITGSGNDKVWGGDGDDLIDAGAGDDIVFGGAGDDDIEGGAGNDRIWGDEGADRIDGGAGDDRIEGGAGFDTLFGGADNDTFLFRSIADVNGDRIGDFAPGDHVDLHFLDADDTSDGNNAFTLQAGGTFTAAGELIVRFDAVANQTAIEGNTDGDISTAEFSLILDGDRVDELVVNNSIIL